MKKIILTCLAAAMTLAGSAQETATIDGITYLLDGGKASVMQQKGLTGDIVIPETVRYGGDDYTVTTVQNNAFSGNDITGVVLPNTVTVMGSSCFSSCSKLVSADLPDNITSLGGNSFSFCYSLKSVDLPEALVSLGDMCFESCRQELHRLAAHVSQAATGLRQSVCPRASRSLAISASTPARASRR